MGRHPSRFTEADISRVLKVAKRLGVDVRIEVKMDGTMVVQTKGDALQLDNSGDQQANNEWDEAYGKTTTEIREGGSKQGR
jgi:hypothetical protein